METVIKKFALIIVAIFFMSYSCETLYAQERNKGYQGSVSYSNMILLWNGIETSHGYMFNEYHYLGAGVGLFVIPFPNKDNLQNVEIEPSIGWSWILKSGNALALSSGVNIVPEPIQFTETESLPSTATPCLCFGFEF